MFALYNTEYRVSLSLLDRSNVVKEIFRTKKEEIYKLGSQVGSVKPRRRRRERAIQQDNGK